MADTNTAIRVENLSKKFCRNLKTSLSLGAWDLGRSLLGLGITTNELRKDEFWAVRDVSFEIPKGEALGLLGSNGSGKSTLLRMLAGIYPPDAGAISIHGRIGALIALGAGFHPHMTGRENIYLNGSILGLSRREITERLASIIDFAEIGDFIEAPVSTYSSGMTVRLGFSIAVHARADILLVDEVLAVGDLAFTLKCYKKMAEFRQNGGTTVLVSHNNQLIRNVCDKALWLEKGRLLAYGNVHEVCDQYEKAAVKRGPSDGGQFLHYDEHAKIEEVSLLNDNGDRVDEFKIGAPLTVEIRFRTNRTIKKPNFAVSIESAEKIVCICNFSHLDNYEIAELSTSGAIRFRIPQLALKNGRYFLTVTFNEESVQNHISWGERVLPFNVSGSQVSYGIFNPFGLWTLVGEK